MSKREAELKAMFTRELKRQLPRFIVQLFSSANSPDRSITGNGRTTHWEFKHGTPDFESPGGQTLFCARLAAQGHCRYVIWQEDARGGVPRTLIVHPKMVLGRDSPNIVAEDFCIDYDMRWLVEQVKRAHHVR